MASWQPPIPSGALYSKAARALGPALPLLAYCYDKVLKDGWLTIALKEAAGDMDEAYPTVKRWWQLIEDGPFFAEVEKHGRNGMRARFKDIWLDWRILNAREKAPDVFGTDTGSEMIPNEPETIIRDTIGIINGTNTGSEMIPQQSGIKVLMTPDQALDLLALNAPQAADKKEPVKCGRRDPNQQHPACQLFFEKTGYRPNRQQAADIAATVIDSAHWAASIAAWTGRGYRINDAGGMLDWYLNPDKMQRTNGSNGNGRRTTSIRQNPGGSFERANWTFEGSDDGAVPDAPRNGTALPGVRKPD